MILFDLKLGENWKNFHKKTSKKFYQVWWKLRYSTTIKSQIKTQEFLEPNGKSIRLALVGTRIQSPLVEKQLSSLRWQSLDRLSVRSLTLLQKITETSFQNVMSVRCLIKHLQDSKWMQFFRSSRRPYFQNNCSAPWKDEA